MSTGHAGRSRGHDAGRTRPARPWRVPGQPGEPRPAPAEPARAEPAPAQSAPAKSAPVGSAAESADPADRGALRIDHTVLRRIVEHTADQVPGTLSGGSAAAGGRAVPGARARLSGRGTEGRGTKGRGTGGRGTEGRADDDGADLDVAVELALVYPAPIRATVDEVGERVRQAVRRLTGHRVRSVSVTVSALLPRSRPRVE
ncbi:Asp23/Gls24 family envelope stress response protein [Goodfellowiella coeruleoviolacea]|uniref:Conserved protein YloU, alkaline shock protein (Asp23) family n=1 Tax=Goodfellowiella coeruleoviolacea TaxID=334858 RepID=A0AAE3KGP1_9PSEU|nr:Asp23/Gls24 family envelope stress response protein [Goodfellowiella coeruleoviolacea]MCP2166415.1 putative conserved protein YloU, alkaline shock protein (Asp23) family [Goodfellowiella coeruleoviolacea]